MARACDNWLEIGLAPGDPAPAVRHGCGIALLPSPEPPDPALKEIKALEAEAARTNNTALRKQAREMKKGLRQRAREKAVRDKKLARRSSAVASSASRPKVTAYVFGGQCGKGARSSDLWTLALGDPTPRWVVHRRGETDTDLTWPRARSAHAMAAAPDEDMFFVFGGEGDPETEDAGPEGKPHGGKVKVLKGADHERVDFGELWRFTRAGAQSMETEDEDEDENEADGGGDGHDEEEGGIGVWECFAPDKHCARDALGRRLPTPSKRRHATLTYVPAGAHASSGAREIAGSSLWMYGGAGADVMRGVECTFNDLFVLELAAAGAPSGMVWHSIALSGCEAPRRASHSATAVVGAVATHIVLVGGTSSTPMLDAAGEVVQDGWAGGGVFVINTCTLVLSELRLTAPRKPMGFAARFGRRRSSKDEKGGTAGTAPSDCVLGAQFYGHGAAANPMKPGQIIVFGGRSILPGASQGSLQQAWVFDTGINGLDPEDAAEQPGTRACPIRAHIGGLVFGFEPSDHAHNHGNMRGQVSTQAPTAQDQRLLAEPDSRSGPSPAPQGRCDFVMASATPSSIMVFGGISTSTQSEEPWREASRTTAQQLRRAQLAAELAEQEAEKQPQRNLDAPAPGETGGACSRTTWLMRLVETSSAYEEHREREEEERRARELAKTQIVQRREEVEVVPEWGKSGPWMRDTESTASAVRRERHALEKTQLGAAEFAARRAESPTRKWRFEASFIPRNKTAAQQALEDESKRKLKDMHNIFGTEEQTEKMKDKLFSKKVEADAHLAGVVGDGKVPDAGADVGDAANSMGGSISGAAPATAGSPRKSAPQTDIDPRAVGRPLEGRGWSAAEQKTWFDARKHVRAANPRKYKHVRPIVRGQAQPKSAAAVASPSRMIAKEARPAIPQRSRRSPGGRRTRSPDRRSPERTGARPGLHDPQHRPLPAAPFSLSASHLRPTTAPAIVSPAQSRRAHTRTSESVRARSRGGKNGAQMQRVSISELSQSASSRRAPPPVHMQRSLTWMSSSARAGALSPTQRSVAKLERAMQHHIRLQKAPGPTNRAAKAATARSRDTVVNSKQRGGGWQQASSTDASAAGSTRQQQQPGRRGHAGALGATLPVYCDEQHQGSELVRLGDAVEPEFRSVLDDEWQPTDLSDRSTPQSGNNFSMWINPGMKKRVRGQGRRWMQMADGTVDPTDFRCLHKVKPGVQGVTPSKVTRMLREEERARKQREEKAMGDASHSDADGASAGQDVEWA